MEKLCQRFRLSEDTRQWRDIAFCLSLLPFKSERSVKKLVEGLSFYRDKLHEEGVYARFQEILAKARPHPLPFPHHTLPYLPLPSFLFSRYSKKKTPPKINIITHNRLALTKPRTNPTRS